MAELGAEEKFALTQIFADEGEFSLAVRAGLADAELESRQITAMGFRAMIRFREPLPSVLSMPEADWAFRHRLLSHGGGFFCHYFGEQHLILDAMSFYGEWPSEFRAADFEKI